MREGLESAPGSLGTTHASINRLAAEENHGILQIDVSNVCISINRAVVLHNMNILCPEFATYIYNCYETPVRLFISGGKEIQSTESTTQENPVALGMCTTGMFLLLHLNDSSNEMNERTKC